MAYRDGGRIITDGLLLSLDAADRNSYVGSGTVWNDLSGNNYTMTLANSPSFSSLNQGSLFFSGSTSGSTAAFKGVSAGNNINNNTTNEVWYKWNGVNQAQTLSVVGNLVISGYLGFFINDGSINPNIGNKVVVIFGGQTYSAINTGTRFATLVSNQWTQLVITKDTTTTRLYQDGQFLGSTTTTQSAFSTTSPYLLPSGFQGNITSCKLYNKALSAQEVQQNYNAQKSRFGL